MCIDIRKTGAGGTSQARVAHRRQTGLHKILTREGWPNVEFAFHDGETLGPKMLARIAKPTGLHPDDL
jgi:hypothetical protein